MKTCGYSLLALATASPSKLNFRDDNAASCAVTFEGGKLLAPCAFETDTTTSIWDAIHDLQRGQSLIHHYLEYNDANFDKHLDYSTVTETPTKTPTAYPTPLPDPVVTIFTYTGSDQQFTVPSGTTFLHVRAQGAKGGGSSVGGECEGNYLLPAVSTGGDVWTVVVGESGGTSYGGGGRKANVAGNHGGGYSGVFLGHTCTDNMCGARGERGSVTQSNAIVVGGGGGGAGTWSCHSGGSGGGDSGGSCGFGANGGTQTGGGAGSTRYGKAAQAGGALFGGNAHSGSDHTGGGGGGWFGGGGGAQGCCGPGGSGYKRPELTSSSCNSGTTGAGQVTITAHFGPLP